MEKFRQIYERPTCLAAASLLRVWSSDRVLLALPTVLVAPRAVRAGGQGGQYEEFKKNMIKRVNKDKMKKVKKGMINTVVKDMTKKINKKKMKTRQT